MRVVMSEKIFICVGTSLTQLTTYIRVFSPNRLDTVCAMTNAEMDKWHAALDNVVKDNLSRDQIAERDRALQVRVIARVMFAWWYSRVVEDVWTYLSRNILGGDALVGPKNVARD